MFDQPPLIDIAKKQTNFSWKRSNTSNNIMTKVHFIWFRKKLNNEIVRKPNSLLKSIKPEHALKWLYENAYIKKKQLSLSHAQRHSLLFHKWLSDQFKNLNVVYLQKLVISKAGIMMPVEMERGGLNLKEVKKQPLLSCDETVTNQPGEQVCPTQPP